MIAAVDAPAAGAAQLLAALNDAADRFAAFGREQSVSHPGIGWERFCRLGAAIAPLATVGVVFELRDDEDRQVCLGVSVWLREDAFVVELDATVDDPIPAARGNQRFLLEGSEVRTQRLDECLDALRDFTARLCAYTSVLDELGGAARRS
jgi:hypothetical protein